MATKPPPLGLPLLLGSTNLEVAEVGEDGLEVNLLAGSVGAIGSAADSSSEGCQFESGTGQPVTFCLLLFLSFCLPPNPLLQLVSFWGFIDWRRRIPSRVRWSHHGSCTGNGGGDLQPQPKHLSF